MLHTNFTALCVVIQSGFLVDKFNAQGSGYVLERRFTKFGELGKKGYYAVQGHSMSPILVLIESSYATSY